jgi:hypothetical protein
MRGAYFSVAANFLILFWNFPSIFVYDGDAARFGAWILQPRHAHGVTVALLFLFGWKTLYGLLCFFLDFELLQTSLNSRPVTLDIGMIFQAGDAGVQQTQMLKESQLVFFGLRDHLWLKGPVVGARTSKPVLK